MKSSYTDSCAWSVRRFSRSARGAGAATSEYRPRGLCPIRWKHLAPLLALLEILLVAPGRVSAATPDLDRSGSNRLMDAHLALQALDMARARALAASFSEREKKSPEVRYFLGRLKFYEGAYDQALHYFSGLTFVDEAGNRDTFPEYVRRVAEATRGMVWSESEHFKIFFDPASLDGILVRYALDTLEKAYLAVGSELGHYPPEQVRVEIFPTSARFIQASGLTAEEIETTGTVALCIYNKIMITSPRALALGYRWLDTLSHEYVHLVVAQRSRNTVPVWLQEGLAKFFEVRWRGGRGADMTRTSESLLAEAIRADRLVPFDRMSPSLAKLPSAEEAQLAFAEVQTVIEYLVQERGLEALGRLMDEMAAGKSDRRVIEEIMGVPFPQFEVDWKAFMARKQLRFIPRLAVLPTILEAQEVGTDEEQKQDKVADPFMAENRALREYARLGDLLRERGRFKAALIEYGKARDSVEVESPALSVKIALTHLLGDQPEEAVAVLEEAIDMYPSFAPAYTTLARALIRLEDADGAVEALENANAINPFDPSIHELLAVLYQAAGEPETARAEHRVAMALRTGRPLIPHGTDQDEPTP